MFLLKHFVKKPLLTKSLPLISRMFCAKTEPATSACTCSCCTGDAYCEIDPAGIRTPAPDFKAKAWHNGFKDVNLADYKGKYVVLFFYPLDFTFVCPTEIIEFSKKSPQFRETGKSGHLSF